MSAKRERADLDELEQLKATALAQWATEDRRVLFFRTVFSVMTDEVKKLALYGAIDLGGTPDMAMMRVNNHLHSYGSMDIGIGTYVHAMDWWVTRLRESLRDA